MDIRDFGEHIPDSDRERWAVRQEGYTAEALEEALSATGADGTIYDFVTSDCSKDNVWKPPAWHELVAGGYDPCVAYIASRVRRALPPRPVVIKGQGRLEGEYLKEVARDWVGVYRTARDGFAAARSLDEAEVVCIEVKYMLIELEGSCGRHKRELDKVIRTVRDRTEVERLAEASGIALDPAGKRAAAAERSIVAMQVTARPTTHPKYRDYLVVPARYITDGDRPAGTRCRLTVRGDRYNELADAAGGGGYVLWDERKGTREPLAAVGARDEDVLLVRAQLVRQAAEGTRGPAGKAPFQLEAIKDLRYTGPDHIGRGAHVRVGGRRDDMTETLGLRGGQFGSTMSAAERQEHLDRSFEAFIDLARATGVAVRDVSLGGGLAMAYGARGGRATRAAAFFEPSANVINLTRKRGAGSLAHEFFHALDHWLAGEVGQGGKFLSESPRLPYIDNDVASAMRGLLDACRWKTVTEDKAASVAAKHAVTERVRADTEGIVRRCVRSELYDGPRAAEWAAAVARFTAVTEAGAAEDGAMSYEQNATAWAAVRELSEASELLCGHRIGNTNEIPNLRLQAKRLYRAARDEHRTALAPAQTNTVMTDFHRGSKAFDERYGPKGYWASPSEMLARAFACYVK